MTLEILDAHGQLVRKFSSDDKPQVTEADLKKQLIPLYWLAAFRALARRCRACTAGCGICTILRPIPLRHEYPIAAIPGDTPRYPLGPTALPGTYTARLT